MEIRRYDVVEANLAGTIGSEQGGIRPVLVIQNDMGNLHSSTTIVIPFTTKEKVKLPTHTLIKKDKDNGLSEDSILLGEQIRTISSDRIIEKKGRIVNNYYKNEIKRIYLANLGD